MFLHQIDSVKIIKGKQCAMASVAQLVEESSHKPKGSRLDPQSGEGTNLGCGFGSWLGYIGEATNPCLSHIDLTLFLPPFSPFLSQ